jgi:SAM-dependent methyltransferase
MEAEYTAPRDRLSWLKDWLRREDYRTKSSLAACARVLSVPDGSLCLSIGGGPLRVSEKLVNLNIGRFPNVDVVGDAHRLPYADASVDAVHCEAVFEHLHSPAVAARELARALKPGALAFVCTPFLQAFHGYPSHFQNFTIYGHRKLFEDSGLEILESGVCNGPAMAMIQMWRVFGDLFVPRVLRPLTRAVYVLGRVVVAPLDRILGDRENAYVLASTTYLVARKP